MPPDMEVLITGPLGKFLAGHFHIHPTEYKTIIKVTMGLKSQKSYFQNYHTHGSLDDHFGFAQAKNTMNIAQICHF